jgi:Ca2+-binding RTX toxin-like protein
MPSPTRITLTNDNDIYSLLQSNALVFGLAGDDVISIGAFPNPSPSGVTVLAGPGNDTVYGGRNNDVVYGNSGNDILFEGGGLFFGGDDTFYGGTGNDVLRGGDGNDTLYGERDRDTLYGDAGNDTLFGGQAADVLYGGVGQDVLFGNESNDRLNGNGGSDTLEGGQGNDWLEGGSGNDLYRYTVGLDDSDTINDFAGEGDRLFLMPGAEGQVLAQEIIIGQSASGAHVLIGFTSQLGSDQIRVLNQAGHGAIETIALQGGASVSSAQLTQLIQDMTAYLAAQPAGGEVVDLSNLAAISANANLMALIANTFGGLVG